MSGELQVVHAAFAVKVTEGTRAIVTVYASDAPALVSINDTNTGDTVGLPLTLLEALINNAKTICAGYAEIAGLSDVSDADINSIIFQSADPSKKTPRRKLSRKQRAAQRTHEEMCHE